MQYRGRNDCKSSTHQSPLHQRPPAGGQRLRRPQSDRNVEIGRCEESGTAEFASVGSDDGTDPGGSRDHHVSIVFDRPGLGERELLLAHVLIERGVVARHSQHLCAIADRFTQRTIEDDFPAGRDADGSHAPEQLHRLLDAIDAGADLAIGSRYIEGGTVQNWPRRRLVLSKTANTYSRMLLGVRINDITAGYRAYRREVLEKIDLGAVDSKGYCFQIDLTWRTINNGFTVAEVPITFAERELGVSKMSGSNIREAMLKVARWGINGRLDRARGIAPYSRPNTA